MHGPARSSDNVMLQLYKLMAKLSSCAGSTPALQQEQGLPDVIEEISKRRCPPAGRFKHGCSYAVKVCMSLSVWSVSAFFVYSQVCPMSAWIFLLSLVTSYITRAVRMHCVQKFQNISLVCQGSASRSQV